MMTASGVFGSILTRLRARPAMIGSARWEEVLLKDGTFIRIKNRKSPILVPFYRLGNIGELVVEHQGKRSVCPIRWETEEKGVYLVFGGEKHYFKDFRWLIGKG